MEKIKTLQEYQDLASRTCPDLGEEVNKLHMWLGVQTEIGEILDIFKKNIAYQKPLDLVNLGEELADIMWYEMNDLRMKYNNSIPLNLNLIDDNLEELITYYKTLTFDNDTAKVIYSVELFQELIRTYNELEIEDIIALYMLIAHVWGLDFYQLLTNNIQKLLTRYPEKFTNEAALNRNLEAERVNLEQDGSITN